MTGKETWSPFLPSSSLESGLSFCSRNLGARRWSASQMPNRSKSEAAPVGIPVSGGGPGTGVLCARSPACLSVPLTLREQKECTLRSHKVWVSCGHYFMHAFQSMPIHFGASIFHLENGPNYTVVKSQ